LRRFGKTGLIFLVLLVILLALTHRAAHSATHLCWDGVEVDESLLMELCGITETEYYEMDPADCPQSVEAVTMIGGCEPDYAVITISMMLVAFVYSLLFLGIVWIRHQRAQS
jgi:hypothetical protein